jgi:hypothetical protein
MTPSLAAAPAAHALPPEPLALAGLRVVVRIAEASGLTVDEPRRRLGQPPRSIFFAGHKHPDCASLRRATLDPCPHAATLLHAWDGVRFTDVDVTTA